MQKKEKIIFFLVILSVIFWAISISFGILKGKLILLREISIVVLLITYFIYFNFSFLRKWQKRIENSDSVETALAKYNYFGICTCEENIIIYCNDKFLRLLGYTDSIFVIGKHLKDIFNTDTYSEIEKYVNSSERDFKYLNGYLYNKNNKFIYVKILVQKLFINGKRYEHIDIVDDELLQELLSYVPYNLTKIFDQIDDAIIYIDTDNNIKWVNKETARLLNISTPENLIGEKCHKIFWGQEYICEDCLLKKILSTSEKVEIIKQFPNGKYYLIKTDPIKNDKGEITGIVKLIRDITSQREAEIKRLETERRLLLISEQLPTLIWATDENLKVTYVSGAILKNINMEASYFIGKTLYELFNTTDPENPIIKHALLSLTGESSSYQMRFRGRDYIVYFKPFTNQEGKITGCTGLSQDITELITIQKELEYKNQILTLIGEINKAISKAKSENQLITEIIALLKDSLIAKNAYYLVKNNKSDSVLLSRYGEMDRLAEYLSNLKFIDSGISDNPLSLCYFDMEIKIINNTDNEKINPLLKSVFLECNYKSAIFIPIIIDTRVHSILCLVSDKKSQFKHSDYYKNIGGDISVAISNFILQERQRENEEIIRKNQLIIFKAQKYEYASRYAAGIAHDFNNLLFRIKSYIELIHSSIHNDDRTESYFNQINQAIQKGSELTSYLMKYSTYESMNKIRTDINYLYNQILTRLNNLCSNKSVKLYTEYKCKNSQIFCDIEKITEAIEICTRYIINRSTDDSPIFFNVEDLYLETESDENNKEDMFKIEIMSKTLFSDEILSDNIFELKLLVNTEEQPEFNLPSVSNIIRLHGGYIYSDKKANGSGFVIILPTIYDESRLLTQSFNTPENDINILIVEDDPYVKEPIEIILKELNCNILTASDGAEALKLAARINYNIHLIITDVEMPVIDGITLAEEIYKKNHQVKIIYISGYIKDFASKENRLIQDSFFLQKPFALDTLRQIVKDALKRIR